MYFYNEFYNEFQAVVETRVVMLNLAVETTICSEETFAALRQQVN